MEGLVELHDNIMYYLVVILFAVAWVLLSIVRNYIETKSPISHKYLNHGIISSRSIASQLKSVRRNMLQIFNKVYLSLLPLTLNPYAVVLLLESWVKKNKFQNLKIVIYCFSFSIFFDIKPYHIFVNKEVPSVAYGRRVVLLRNYSSKVLPNIPQPVKSSEDGNQDTKYFYEWLCGLTDGEGTFYILRKNDRGSFEFNFLIGLHIDDVNMLRFIREVLGTGKVVTSGKVARFSITSIKGIAKIIDILTEYPLNTTKLLNFLAFKKAYELYTSSKSKEDVAQFINELKNSMNNKRTDFNMPYPPSGDQDYKPRITSYWLLGFVEGGGAGSFFVKKSDYKLNFTLSQSIKDLALMESIKDFLCNLPGIANSLRKDFQTSIRVTTQDSASNTTIVRLTISQTDLIKFVIIPLFSSMTWRSKKEWDFQDWVATFELKERGHHYQEEGKNVLNLIISQMNNRLSSNQDENYPVIDREQLYLKINQLLNGPSNIEVKEDGRLFIKSLNRFYTGSGKTEVQIISDKGLVLKTFTSLSDGAKFLGLTQPTVKNRLIKNQAFLFEGNPCYLKRVINDDSDFLVSLNPEVKNPEVKNPEVKSPKVKSLNLEVKSLNTEIELKNRISATPQGAGKPVNVYEKVDSSGFKLIGSFVSARTAGKFIGISGSTVIRYVQSGQIYNERYKFSSK